MLPVSPLLSADARGAGLPAFSLRRSALAAFSVDSADANCPLG